MCCKCQIMHKFAPELHNNTNMSKTERLLEIRKIINSHKIGSQEELLEMLNNKGIGYTQATLSRDLRFLKAAKMPDDEKGMIYVLPESFRADATNFSVSGSETPTGFISIEYNSIFAVIKTLPGFASSLAYRIDAMNAFEIIGTIAGDDTVLVISREGIPRSAVVQRLRPLIMG